MATIRVKTDFPTIQAAVDAALPGDMILVEDGVYSEQVVGRKDFITIRRFAQPNCSRSIQQSDCRNQ